MDPSDTRDMDTGAGTRLRRRTLLKGLGAGAAAIALQACTGGTPPAGGATTAPAGSGAATAPARRGGQIVIATNGDVPHQDPLQYQGAVFDNTWRNDFVYDRLVELDPKTLEPVPHLAERWETLDGGRLYRFHLRSNVKWHDGAPFSAQDVEFTLRRLLHKESPAPQQSYQGIVGAAAYTKGEATAIAGVTVVDARTIEIQLSSPTPAFLSVGAWGLKPIPKHLVDGQPFKQAPYYTKPVGTGPWRSVEWAQGDHQTFEANADHWAGRPNLDRIIYRFIPDANAIVNALEAGDVNATYLIPPSEVARLQRNAKLKVINTPQYNIEAIVFNTTNGALRDARVRKAIAHAFDIATFTKQHLEGATEPARGPLLPSSWAFDSSITYPTYDVARAKQLLADAGHASGLQLKLMVNTGNAMRELEATVLQSALAAVGIKLDLEFVEFAVFNPRLTRGDFQMATFGGSGSGGHPDPDALRAAFHSKGGLNRTKFSDPKMDDLLTTASTTIDRAQRKSLYSEVQRILADQMPEIFAFYRPIPLGHSATIEGVVTSAGRPYFNVARWSLKA